MDLKRAIAAGVAVALLAPVPGFADKGMHNGPPGIGVSTTGTRMRKGMGTRTRVRLRARRRLIRRTLKERPP